MSDQLSLTVDPLADAVAWKKNNPEAWDALVRWAHADRQRGIRPSVDAYFHVLRRPYMASLLGVVPRAGEPVLLNNDLTSFVARLLNREFPDLRIPTRSARVDGWQEAS